MTKQIGRRRWLALCGTSSVLGLAGCLGGSSDDTETGGDSEEATNGDDEQEGDAADSNADTETTSGLTIGHNTQTGRYVFEGGIPSAMEAGNDPDEFIWDVTSLDGYDATVEATFIEYSVLGDTETMSLTASPDVPEPSMTNPSQIGEGYDISELLPTRMVERWFPNYLLGEVDLETLAVGTELDPEVSSITFDVVGTETYAGIEGYVLESWLLNEEYLGNYCVSPEHAMVIAGEEYDDDRDEVTYRLELVSYEG